MVAMFEIVFLIVCAVLVVWWFRRTNIYRAYRRSGVVPGRHQWAVRIHGVGGPTGGPQRRGSWRVPEPPNE